jgi:hypothetical protein
MTKSTKLAALCLVAWTAQAADVPVQANRIGAVKLIIGNVKENQSYFEHMFGMKEVGHYSDAAAYDEPIMGFDDGAHLAGAVYVWPFLPAIGRHGPSSRPG